MTNGGPIAPISAIVSDLDRTLSLHYGIIGPTARRAIELAHRHQLAFIVASGRERSFLERIGNRHREIDGFVAENGCVLIVRGDGWSSVRLYDTEDLISARERIAGADLPETEFGDVIVSVRRGESEEVERLLRGLKVDLVPNVDRLMVLPEGVTKLTGTMALLDRLELDPWAFAAIGDAENDYELLANARVSGAPWNAVPRLRELATYRCRRIGPRGVLEFVEFLTGSAPERRRRERRGSPKGSRTGASRSRSSGPASTAAPTPYPPPPRARPGPSPRRS